MLNWLRYRLFGRCFTCGRLIVLHSPWALYICERTPLDIVTADSCTEGQGEDLRTAQAV